jgi:hypothetical protein
MIRIIKILLLLFLIISFSGCNFEGSALSKDQQEAVTNSIDFINDSSFTAKERIDTDKIKITNPTDKTWKSVWYKGKSIEENAIDSTDWIITIGDTSYYDFAIIVCDSDTCKVVGYIPID